MRRQITYLFPRGTVVESPEAQALFKRLNIYYWEFVARHFLGDWGELCTEDDVRTNEHHLKHGLPLMSIFSVGDEVLWVVTEADRSKTTVLLQAKGKDFLTGSISQRRFIEILEAELRPPGSTHAQSP